MMSVRELLEKGVMLFDGAMGTYFSSLPGREDERCEQANLDRSDEIAAIHEAYLRAGCHAIKTNTFTLCAELTERPEEAFAMLDAGCRIAKDAAAPFGAQVFADLGPAPSEADAAAIYCLAADRFLENGMTNFLVETLSSDDGIAALAEHLKARCPEAFLLVSYAVSPEGITCSGSSGLSLLRRTAALSGVDAVGLNCVSGSTHILKYVQSLPLAELGCFCVMPNAGYPTVLGRRMVFHETPEYFAMQMAAVAAAGVQIVGGCCGTTPKHIEKTAQALRQAPKARIELPGTEQRAPRAAEVNPFWDKLEAGKKVIAVELDPPADDDIEPFMSGVAMLRDAGADLITVGDCPVGRPRADSSLLSCKMHRELGVQALPHMTCRDRNLIATKALLLGLSVEGIHNVLLITGDPIPNADRSEVKAVFNFNSRKLAAYVTTLNETTLKTPFRIFGALNVNALNFDIQLRIALEKEECGVSGFLTQPIHSPQALENLKRAREVLHGRLLAGIYPIVSHRNACFMNNEVPGIRVSEDIIAAYEGLDRAQAEKLALELSLRTAEAAAPYCDGIYLMTPFRRTELITRIISGIRGE